MSKKEIPKSKLGAKIVLISMLIISFVAGALVMRYV